MNQDDQKVDPRTESFNNEIVNSNLSSLVATDTPKPAQVRPISSGPPTFSDEELERLETAKSFARSIQQVVIPLIIFFFYFYLFILVFAIS